MAEQNEKPQKKKPFLIIFICIIMIALGLVAGIFISNLLNKSPDRTYDNNAEDIKEKMMIFQPLKKLLTILLFHAGIRSSW